LWQPTFIHGLWSWIQVVAHLRKKWQPRHPEMLSSFSAKTCSDRRKLQKKKLKSPEWSSGPGLFQLLSWCLGFSNPKTHWLQKTMTWSCSLFLSGCPHLLWPCERTIVRAPAPSRSVLKGCRSAVPQWHGF
jgi:hypothetical protein